jgi:hypothetical protein
MAAIRARVARDACLTGGSKWAAAVSARPDKAYVSGGATARGLGFAGTVMMAHRLQHDIELAQRGTALLLVGLVLAAFLLLAAASTVYDVGQWLTIW